MIAPFGRGAGASIAVGVLMAMALSSMGCSHRTSDEDFGSRVSLVLAATMDGDLAVFELAFSTAGEPVWPGVGSVLQLYVDGKPVALPPQVIWSSKVRTSRIVPEKPRRARWYMTSTELRDWLGAGTHALSFRFRDVASNELAVEVQASGNTWFFPQLQRKLTRSD